MQRADAELARLTEDWRSIDPGPGRSRDVGTLRREMGRRNLRFRWVALSEAAIMVAFLSGLGLFAWNSHAAADVAMATAFSLVIVCGLARWAIVTWRHWKPASETTAEFINLMYRRALQLRLQLKIGWAFLAFEVAVFIPWIANTLSRPHDDHVPARAALLSWGLLGLMVSLAVVLLLLVHRHNRMDLARWERLRKEWQE